MLYGVENSEISFSGDTPLTTYDNYDDSSVEIITIRGELFRLKLNKNINLEISPIIREIWSVLMVLTIVLVVGWYIIIL